MRHVVEHLLNPIELLTKISNTLSDSGFIYIAVPDMMHPRTKLRDYDKWWEYYFRSVHPFYYCKYTLFQLMKMCGLEVMKHGEVNEEIWVLARRSGVRHHYKKSKKLKQQQLDILNEFLP